MVQNVPGDERSERRKWIGVYLPDLIGFVLGAGLSLMRRTLLLRHLAHVRSASGSKMPRHSCPQRRHLKVTCSAIALPVSPISLFPCFPISPSP